VKREAKSPSTNKVRAALREAFGLNIENGFDSPISGTHVPKGIEQIGC
jgi:hypothetical protein